MRITVQRTIWSDKSTIGQMLVDDRFFGYTLEDTDRYLEDGGEKITHVTAIPRGVYPVTLYDSPRFHGPVLLLHNVDGFNMVEVHWGNKPEDTDGCILVGDSYADDWISHSRATFAKLLKVVEQAMDRGEAVTLEVV